VPQNNLVTATTISSETYTVNLRSQSYANLYIDASAHEGSVVEGSISVTGGQINFYVMDQDGWNSYQYYDPTSATFFGPDPTALEEEYFADHFHCQVFAKFVTSYQFSFVPSQTDHYYFVFDNRYNNDWLTNKQVSLDVKLTYSNPAQKPTLQPVSTSSLPVEFLYGLVGLIVVVIILLSVIIFLLKRKR
jgi:hypothetical protein